MNVARVEHESRAVDARYGWAPDTYHVKIGNAIVFTSMSKAMAEEDALVLNAEIARLLAEEPEFSST